MQKQRGKTCVHSRILGLLFVRADHLDLSLFLFLLLFSFSFFSFLFFSLANEINYRASRGNRWMDESVIAFLGARDGYEE